MMRESERSPQGTGSVAAGGGAEPGVPRRFRAGSLRWKMTLSYTAVTVAALLVVEIVVGVASFGRLALQLDSGYLPGRMFEALSAGYAAPLGPFLTSTPPDQAGLQGWLDQLEATRISVPISGQIPILFAPGELQMTVLDRDGRLLAATSAADITASGVNGGVRLALAPLVSAALSGSTPTASDVARLYRRDGQRIDVAVPIAAAGASGQVLGVLMVSTADITPATIIGQLARILGLSAVLFTLVAGLVGTAFGFLASRGLARRIGRLADTSQRWSRGAFDSRIDDRERDELGWLAHRLDDMAGRLQGLVERSGDLAAAEERERLARELHDSVKQQAFAVSAQIAAAQASLPSGAADSHLVEAGRIVDELRRELTGLIGDLGPVPLAGNDLAAALEQHGASWSRRSGVALTVEVHGGPPLPSGVERALFRIVQEALANVERHSGAASASVALTVDADGFTCTVSDDGRGLAPDSEASGFGLRSMRERAATLGGRLSVESGPHGGTRLVVSAPRERNHLAEQRG